jgi:hypothetical protein
MLSLLGMTDSYVMDGRVITQILDNRGRGESRRLSDDDHGDTVTELGNVYKQLNAPYGAFGLDTLVASTTAIKSTDDLVYDSIETKIANLTFARDVLAGTIRSALDDVSFGGGKVDSSQARAWIRQAQSLIDQAHALATS